MSPVAYVSLGLLGCLLAGPCLEGVQAASCPVNWLDYNGHCYGYFSQEVNWNRAEALCQRSGGHLASILDRNEHQAIADFLRQAQGWDDEDVWIGLSIPAQVSEGSLRPGPAGAAPFWRAPLCLPLPGFMLWDEDSCYDRNPYLCKM
nr:dromaiocalcin-1-like [Pogona vitticeps]